MSQHQSNQIKQDSSIGFGKRRPRPWPTRPKGPQVIASCFGQDSWLSVLSPGLYSFHRVSTVIFVSPSGLCLARCVTHWVELRKQSVATMRISYLYQFPNTGKLAYLLPHYTLYRSRYPLPARLYAIPFQPPDRKSVTHVRSTSCPVHHCLQKPLQPFSYHWQKKIWIKTSKRNQSLEIRRDRGNSLRQIRLLKTTTGERRGEVSMSLQIPKPLKFGGRAIYNSYIFFLRKSNPGIPFQWQWVEQYKVSFEAKSTWKAHMFENMKAVAKSHLVMGIKT